ncbi:helix-turn-helix transcriptional regulator [Aliiruegeria haliotis]|uniref:helix-turn-helix transcriptional regulator n=1 Tax=Aliiruegeria haliotis TaxID=1280846 RepID=UPI001304CD7D|nr:helix-turn-helix transcriptional regulator [Aliiruegeria haliotis]
MILTDQHRQLNLKLGEKGNIAKRFTGFEAILNGLWNRGRLERTSTAWLQPDGAVVDDVDNASEDPLLVFVHPVETGQVLSGGLVLDRKAIGGFGFAGVENLLSFLGTQAACAARWRNLEEERRAIGKLISALALQCVIVDRNGRIVYENTRNRGNLAATGRPNERRGATRGAIVRSMIDQAVTEYRASSTAQKRRYHVVAVSRNTREVVPLYIVPLSALTSDKEDAEFLALLVPSPTEPIQKEALVRAFSLTPAEAKVVRRIIAGMNIKDIARETVLTEQTVRTYLKHSYEKLGVSSKSELVAKVVSLSIPLDQRQQRLP